MTDPDNLGAQLAEFATVSLEVYQLAAFALAAPALADHCLHPADIGPRTWQHLREAHELLGEVLTHAPGDPHRPGADVSGLVPPPGAVNAKGQPITRRGPR